MKLIAGLGNPGDKYRSTRHNVGFMVADILSRRHGISVKNGKWKAESGKGTISGVQAFIVKPQTFMNLSGESVGPLAAYLDIGPEDVIVVHDELDLPFGKIKIKSAGGHGGHNGLKSLISHLGSPDFARVRVGIGKPQPKGDVSAYVLAGFDSEENKELDSILQKAADAVELICTQGLSRAMNDFN